MISIVIPTHNRLPALLDTVNTLLGISYEANFEIVVVDNNSSDGTAAVINNLQQANPGLIRYIHEPRRAACAARNAGARNAHGDIILFLDDDVLVEPGSLARIQQIFDTHPSCGMVAAQVLPRFEAEPPEWSFDCQASYNGWSLFYPGNQPYLANGLQETSWAIGAMHAVSRQAYEKAGGYPPDIVIIGQGASSYRLDIGAGDSGLAHLVKKLGLIIIYDPQVCGHHLVPVSRFTPQFWRARMVSEAHYHVVSKRVFWDFSPAKLLLDRKRVQIEFFKAIRALVNRLDVAPPEGGIYPEEMWVYYYLAYLNLDLILRQHPSFCLYLDEISRHGVPEGSDPELVFPETYRSFVAKFFRKPLQAIQSIADLENYLAEIDLVIRDECVKTEAVLAKAFNIAGEPMDLIRERLTGKKDGGAQLLHKAAASICNSEWAIPWLVALYAEAGNRVAISSILKKNLSHSVERNDEIKLIAEQLGIAVTAIDSSSAMTSADVQLSPDASSQGESMGDINDPSGTQVSQRLLYMQYRQSLAAGIKLPSFAEAGFSVYSQTDEDGILLMIFAAIGMTNRFYVDMAYQSPLGANTTNLICNWGWNGFMVEGDSAGALSSQEWFAARRDTRVYPPKIIQAWITAENINQLLQENNVTGEVDLLSLDVDGVDIWLWNALTAISPRVIVLEFMNIWGADSSVTVPYRPDFDRHNYHADFFGASLPAFVKLGQVKGYRLIGCNRLGYNAFFLRNDIAQNIFPEVTAESCLALPYPQHARATRLKAVEHLPWQQV
ncbi:MAG: glycosyltransferase family 2 protein [Geobacteraceae bacterium]|nr:glycosyltransferase family 2 protein [Geobacteraceae bacterium]NTW79395.1 glycosyltransferase family 2 protein [Geobacteraceae bacterium]